MLPFILTVIAGIIIFLSFKEKPSGPCTVIGAILAVVAAFSWVAVPISVSTINYEIDDYNESKFILQHMDLKGMSDLHKAKILEPFLMKDRSMRYCKAHYNSFWFDLYIPDECKDIELMKGW
jgi:hypothetical protein